MNGYLSTKADVFSFGVLMLEILSGRKNLDKKLGEEKQDLLSYVSNSFGHIQFSHSSLVPIASCFDNCPIFRGVGNVRRRLLSSTLVMPVWSLKSVCLVIIST